MTDAAALADLDRDLRDLRLLVRAAASGAVALSEPDALALVERAHRGRWAALAALAPGATAIL